MHTFIHTFTYTYIHQHFAFVCNVVSAVSCYFVHTTHVSSLPDAYAGQGSEPHAACT